jgi:hypothetical protein
MQPLSRVQGDYTGEAEVQFQVIAHLNFGVIHMVPALGISKCSQEPQELGTSHLARGDRLERCGTLRLMHL